MDFGIINDIRYLCFDLDGTLLNKDDTVDITVLSLIKGICENGVRVIIATGRHFREMEKYIHMIGDYMIEAVICCDGQYIYDSQKRCLYEGEFLAIDDVIHIFKTVCPNKLSFFTDFHDYYLCSGKMEKWLRFFVGAIRKSDAVLFTADEFTKISNIQIEKICLPATAYKENTIKKIKGDYTLHLYESGKCEILHSKVNKYLALLQVKGVTAQNVIYFGDDINDIECFDNLAYCVAIGESPASIRKRSIIADCQETLNLKECLEQIYERQIRQKFCII